MCPLLWFRKVLLTRAVNTTWTRKHSIIHFGVGGGGGGTECGYPTLKWVLYAFLSACFWRALVSQPNSKERKRERKYRKSFFCCCFRCCCRRLMVFSWAFSLHHAKLNGFTYSILFVKSPVETQLIVFNCCFSVWKTIAHQLIVCLRVNECVCAAHKSFHKLCWVVFFVIALIHLYCRRLQFTHSHRYHHHHAMKIQCSTYLLYGFLAY